MSNPGFGVGTVDRANGVSKEFKFLVKSAYKMRLCTYRQWECICSPF
jgi:hypothetical protein